MHKFKLNQRVRIACSGEEGDIIGQAFYAFHNEASYLIRYRAADGKATEAWWSEGALQEPGPSRSELDPPL